MRLRSILTIACLIGVLQGLYGQDKKGVISEDGAWCWFSDPRAIKTREGKILTGWITGDGTVQAATLDLSSGKVAKTNLFTQLEVDDHDHPAFVQLPDGHFLAMYTWHSTRKGVLFQRSIQPDVLSFYPAQAMQPGRSTLLDDFPRETFTYANPYYLNADTTLYAFGRWIGFKPNMIRSDDLGRTWADAKVIISRTPFDPSNRPYVKYVSDGRSRIHLVFTDGHPAVEPLNSVYHCYFDSGAFYRSDGSIICKVDDLPFEPQEATMIYRASKKSGRAWLADIALDEQGQPVILYTRHPQPDDHRYHYATYSDRRNRWDDHEICKAGSWFPKTQPNVEEREPYYHGNMSVHPAKTGTIYLSRQVNGVFEIEKRVTTDRGKTWDVFPITQNSSFDQVRPYVPRGLQAQDPEVVFWMVNRNYIHYSEYDSAIHYLVGED